MLRAPQREMIMIPESTNLTPGPLSTLADDEPTKPQPAEPSSNDLAPRNGSAEPHHEAPGEAAGDDGTQPEGEASPAGPSGVAGQSGIAPKKRRRRRRGKKGHGPGAAPDG